MKHLKSYKIFESVGGDLTDIFLEVNDEKFWKSECWYQSQNERWVVIIKTVDVEGEYVMTHRPPLVLIESIERAIDFMNSEGFTNYGITLDDEQYDRHDEIDIEEVSDLRIWSDKFIRIEFWK
jgi:hypothetical protein